MAPRVPAVLEAFTRMTAEGVTGVVSGSTDHFKEVHARSFASGVFTDEVEQLSVAQLWKTQPHLRTVVDFLAEQVAQLGLHVFKQEEKSATRVRGGAVSGVLKTPNTYQTFPELVFALVSGWALYNDVVVYLLPTQFESTTSAPRRWDVHVVPTKNAGPHYEKGQPEPVSYLIGDLEVPAERAVRFRGWTPDNDLQSSSPAETLRLILAEQHAARQFRKQIWKKSGRFGGFFSREADAPRWDDTARGKFYKMVRAFTSNSGERAGEALLLEDGMKYEASQFNAKDEQWLESVKASLEQVAQVYHVNPTMVGVLDNANYSNVREFRRALYGETLGWQIKMIEARFNAFLLPKLGAEEDEFVEFNVEAKLRGSFEEQAKVMSTATGAPWQTVNEARALMNLPPLDGGDELIQPLNVTTGGQASPQDGEENKTAVDNAFKAIVLQSLRELMSV